jgi:hypothetical protein
VVVIKGLNPMISHKVLSQYVRKEPYDKALLLETVHELVKVVLMRHFNQVQKDEDLQSIGTVKVFDLLGKDFIDPSKNLVNILYTNIRNVIGNYLKRDQRISKKTSSLYDYSLVATEHTSYDSIDIKDLLSKSLYDISLKLTNFNIKTSPSLDYYAKNYKSLGFYEKFAITASAVRTACLQYRDI